MFALGCFVGLVVGVLLTIAWAASVPGRNARHSVRTELVTGPGGFADPAPRPNPVRPLSGGLFTPGGPSMPGEGHDGALLADMRRR